MIVGKDAQNFMSIHEGTRPLGDYVKLLKIFVYNKYLVHKFFIFFNALTIEFIVTTPLDTENVVDEVLKEFLAKYGKQWDGKGDEKCLSKAPLEAADLIIEDYQLPCTPQKFMFEIWPSFENM